MINKVEICGVNTSKLPVLTNDEKLALFDRIKKGDKGARDEFINGNLRLVLSVIQKFTSRGESADDLFQVGCIGLMKSVDNFDLSQNVKFSTYAVPMIIFSRKTYILSSTDTISSVMTTLFTILLTKFCRSLCVIYSH